MLSGRGIDGELKSKFGELTEKFWKSSSEGSPSEAKNVQAIYLANGGGSGGGGNKLSELKSNDGTKLIEENNDAVKEFFNVCVGSQNENGCRKDNNNASVVLVGDQGLSENELINGWEGWAVVRSNAEELRHEFKFDTLEQFDISGAGVGDAIVEGGLNVSKLQKVLDNSERVQPNSLGSLQSWFCPGVGGGVDMGCRTGLINKGKLDDNGAGWRFNKFVNADRFKNYLEDSIFKDRGGKIGGLLLLLDLWSPGVSSEKVDSAIKEIKNRLGKNGLDQSLNTLRLVTYNVSADGPSIEGLRYDDKAKVREIVLTQSRQNDQSPKLVVGNFSGHLGVKVGDKTITSKDFDAWNRGTLTNLWKGFELKTDIITLFEKKNNEERMWLLITLLLGSIFDLKQGLSVSVSPISNNEKVILQDLEKK